MNPCGRRRKNRNINADHSEICFKPCGVRGDLLESITIYEDEMEAIRLSDYESLYQQDCADKMNISRPTFSRLVESARKKIATALLNHKILEVKRRNMKEEKILACNNNKCVKRDECQRYKLFIDGAKEYSTNGGTPEKGCKKFILRS